MADVRVTEIHARTTELALTTALVATTASVTPTTRDRTVSRVRFPVVALFQNLKLKPDRFSILTRAQTSLDS